MTGQHRCGPLDDALAELALARLVLPLLPYLPSRCRIPLRSTRARAARLAAPTAPIPAQRRPSRLEMPGRDTRGRFTGGLR